MLRGDSSRTFREHFEIAVDGRAVDRILLRNASGAAIEFLTLGGLVRSLRVPDRDGVLADVVLGFDTVAEYQRGALNTGALIGRYANRIAGGVIHVDSVPYVLATNAGANTLHGGPSGFHNAHWDVELRDDDDRAGAE